VVGRREGWFPPAKSLCFNTTPRYITTEYNMTLIEIEQCLQELRQELKEENQNIIDIKIKICETQNLLQKLIEKKYNISEWKHLKN